MWRERPAGFLYRQATLSAQQIQPPVIAQHRTLRVEQLRQQAVLDQMLAKAALQLMADNGPLAIQQHLAGGAVQPLPRDAEQLEQIFLTDGSGHLGDCHGASMVGLNMPTSYKIACTMTPGSPLIMPTFIALPAFQDNYIWLLLDESTLQVTAVDPGDARP